MPLYKVYIGTHVYTLVEASDEDEARAKADVWYSTAERRGPYTHPKPGILRIELIEGSNK